MASPPSVSKSQPGVLSSAFFALFIKPGLKNSAEFGLLHQQRKPQTGDFQNTYHQAVTINGSTDAQVCTDDPRAIVFSKCSV